MTAMEKLGARLQKPSTGRAALPAALIAVGLLIVYLSNGHLIVSADATPTRYIAASLVHEHNLDLDEFPLLYSGIDSYYLVRHGGHFISKYPVMAGILSVPVHLGAHLVEDLPDSHESLMTQEKFSGALFTALSAFLFFLLAARLSNTTVAAIVTLVYGLATTALSTDSQALWQHGPSKVFLVGAVLLIVSGRERPWLAGLSGAALGMAVLVRPTNAAAVVVVGAWLAFTNRKQLPLFILSGLPCAALLLWLNRDYGSIFGPYSNHGNWHDWTGSAVFTIFAHFFNPNRGILVYSPILAFSFIGIWRKAVKEREPIYILAALLLAAHLFLISRFVIWWGGGAFGPRLASDAMPYFVLFLIPVIQRWAERPRLPGLAAFVLLFLTSFAIHAGNIYSDGPSQWHHNPKLDWYTIRLSNIRDGQIASIWKHRPLIIPFDSIGITPHLTREQVKERLTSGRNIYDPDATYKRAVHFKVNETQPISASLLLAPGRYSLSVRAAVVGRDPSGDAAGSFIVLSGDGQILQSGRIAEGNGAYGRKYISHKWPLNVPLESSFFPVFFTFQPTGKADVRLDYFTLDRLGD